MKETARVEAFSDGVFAIAITLLVLDLKVPVGTPLVSGLVAQWPTYVAYLISFAFILIMWINHHWMFQHITRVNSTFMLLNGLLLLGITVLPFPTNMVAQYLFMPDASIAAAVYNGWFTLIAAFFGLMWSYASRYGRLLSKADQDSDLARVISGRYRWGVPAYLAAMVLSLIWAPAGLLLDIALAVFYAVPREVALPWERALRPD